MLHLRHHYLFAALNQAQWERLVPHLNQCELGAGTRLFFKNDLATAFYVVKSGTIKLYRLSAQGQEKIMRVVKPGQSFAESVLFSDQPHYPVSALALQKSLVVAIEREAYLDLLRESFDTCRAVMAQMTMRIYANWDEIEGLSLHSSGARVAHYLLKLLANTSDPTLQLPSRKGIIAAQLGLAPETFSRALRRLSDSGVIHVEGSTIIVKDRAALGRVTES